jgi:crossover junction endodeoxyribonuclease RuvC
MGAEMCAEHHSTFVIGIDPGLAGALAVLSLSGTLITLADTPTLTLKVQRGRKQVYDVPGMVKLLRPYAGLHLHVYIEESQAMPGQGSRSMFTVGLGYGLWLGILATLELQYTSVRPAVWKQAFNLGRDKEASRLRAMQLYPAADLRRKRDHDRAEALLLAAYGLR